MPIFPTIEIIHKTIKIPGAAYFIFIGIGINIINTGRFGVKITNSPISPNKAPDAPTAKVLNSFVKIKLSKTKKIPANNPEIR